MRLTSWNVAMGLHKKRAAFAELRADVAVLQEVSARDVGEFAQNCWVGNSPHKGLAVCATRGYQVRIHAAYDPRIEFVLPVEVTGPADFLLLGVWAMHGRSRNRILERPNRWQMIQALELYEPLLRSGPCVVAGDFNNGVLWDRPGRAANHAVAVETLSAFGLVSAYHASMNAAQGREAHPTYFWMRREGAPYHIDYIWIPDNWLPGLRELAVGDYGGWVASGLSDHVPLTVDIEIGG